MNIKEQLELLKTEKGGYDKATLKMLGVGWPPPKGWKKKLIENEEKRLRIKNK